MYLKLVDKFGVAKVSLAMFMLGASTELLGADFKSCVASLDGFAKCLQEPGAATAAKIFCFIIAFGVAIRTIEEFVNKQPTFGETFQKVIVILFAFGVGIYWTDIIGWIAELMK